MLLRTQLSLKTATLTTRQSTKYSLANKIYFNFSILKNQPNKPVWEATYIDYQNKVYTPQLTDSETIPQLLRLPDQELIRLDWSIGAFDTKQNLEVPFFDLYTGEYLDQNVQLYQGIFNQPLRRDLVHRAFEYYLKYDMAFTKGSINQSEVSFQIFNFFLVECKKANSCRNLVQTRNHIHRRVPVELDSVINVLLVDSEVSRFTEGRLKCTEFS